jgi:hypothetical protein
MAKDFTNVGSTFMAWDIAVIQARLNELITPATQKPTALNAFSTYFSDIPAPSGIISVPLVTYPTSADSLNNGMVSTSATASVASLTVNNDIGKFFPFNPADAQQFGLDNLLKTWIQPAMYACDRTVSSASMAVALNGANFATASVKAPNSSSFNVALTGRLQAELSTAGINGERIAVLSPTYYWGLITDIASKGNAAGAAALQSGSPNNPLGLVVVEGQDMPALPADTAATSSIVAVIGNKAGVAVGTAIPNVVHSNGSSVVLKSPSTGVNYLVEQYYDESNRRHLIGCSVIYGVAKVQSTIKQVASA